jgi:hypothetical protein
MRLFRLAFLLSISVLLALPAAARIAIGEGNESCGAWTKERRANSIRSRLYETWLLGFVTGHNWADNSKPDFLVGGDVAGIFGWVDEYCRLNPIKDLVNAADELVGVLSKTTGTRL